MIKDINLIQNTEDINSKYNDDYLIQALANMGQRVGIKGDGISYKYFSFNDIINETNVYSHNNHVGYIKYIKSSDSDYAASFGISTIDTETGNIIENKLLSESISVNDCLYFPNNLSFDIPIGGIEKYSKNSICINNGEDLTLMLAGKIMGTVDNDELNTVLYYYKFDISTNLLKYGAKIYHYKTDNTGDWFCLLTTVNEKYEENNFVNSELNNKYKLTINIFNSNTLKDINKSLYFDFKKIFNFSSYSTTNDIPFSLIRNEYEDIRELLNYNDNYTFNYFSNSPVSIIKNLSSNSIYDERTIDLIFDTNKNEYLSIDSEEYESVINLYKNEYNINFNEELYLLNEDCNVLYYNVFNYYNEKFYFSSKKEFVKRILLKLYEKIIKDNDTNITLYIPLDYQFHYICNSNDNMYIYYFTNIYVTFINFDNTNLQNLWGDNRKIICDYSNEISKVKAYNLEINYNTTNDKIINSVNIVDIFTMPYINANNNWSINDNDSNIHAIGKDAGNPNIIIIYNVNNDKLGLDKSYYVLNAISNEKIIKASLFKYNSFKINPALFNNTYTSNIYCGAYIPEINKENIDVFKNCIILSISSLECLEDKSLQKEYKGSYILSFWNLVNENNSYSFKYLSNKDENEYALALGSTINILNSDSNNDLVSLNDQDILILKAVITDLAQQNLAINSNNWILIKNKTAEEYNNIYNENDYVNDLNTIIQYNDNVAVNNNEIEYSQNNRYIDSIKNIKTSNVLYPKWNSTEKIIETSPVIVKEELIKILRNNNEDTKTNLERISKVYVDNKSITNVELLIEEINKYYDIIETKEDREYIIENLVKSNYYYEEYIFNTNIPNIDLAELFIRNFNLLNRLNILSLTKDGLIYNAYIGTSFEDQNKNVLHIGTSKTNINLGSETLINEFDKRSFEEQDTISIDFDNIILNAKKSISSKQNIYNEKTINDITFKFTNINLIGFKDTLDNLYKDNNNLFIEDNIFDGAINFNYKLSLNKLISLYFNDNILNYDKVNIISNENNICNISYDANTNLAYLKDSNEYYIFINKKYDKNIFKTVNGKDIIYCGFTLNIMNYASKEINNNNVLNIILNINE